MKNKILFLFLLVFVFANISRGQNIEKGNESGGVMLHMSYAYHTPRGDLEDRFGNHFSLGTKLEYLSDAKKNFFLGIDANFLFGNTVKEDVINNLRNSNGFIFGNNLAVANIALRQRGFYLGAYAGKLFSLSKKNKRAGLRLSLGMGLFQHKIRIQDDPNSFVAGLNDEYKKGYDRLSNGLAITEFIGYQSLAKNRLANFIIGIEMRQAFTQSRRDFNFDTMMKDEQKRLDLQFGLRVTWILPFYVYEKGEEIFY